MVCSYLCRKKALYSDSESVKSVFFLQFSSYFLWRIKLYQKGMEMRYPIFLNFWLGRQGKGGNNQLVLELNRCVNCLKVQINLFLCLVPGYKSICEKFLYTSSFPNSHIDSKSGFLYVGLYRLYFPNFFQFKKILHISPAVVDFLSWFLVIPEQQTSMFPSTKFVRCFTIPEGGNKLVYQRWLYLVSDTGWW